MSVFVRSLWHRDVDLGGLCSDKVDAFRDNLSSRFLRHKFLSDGVDDRRGRSGVGEGT